MEEAIGVDWGTRKSWFFTEDDEKGLGQKLLCAVAEAYRQGATLQLNRI